MKEVSSSLHPYPLRKDEDGIYTFTTEDGIEYNIIFIDMGVYAEELWGVYQFNIERNQNIVHKIDNRIYHTVIYILERFFQETPDDAILMVCDSSDGKQQKRRKLFDRWYAKSSHKEDIDVFNAEYHDYNNDKVYTSLYINRHTPRYKTVVDSYMQLVRNSMMPI
ncbi:MAG: hypothetical protein KBT34_11355 [Prevotella sp.]|nr:hypothetical protein [Candidatus Prevotella equi]